MHIDVDNKHYQAAIDKKHYQKHEKTKNKIIATILRETLKFGKSRNIEFIPLHQIIVKESQVLIASLHTSPGFGIHS